MRSASLSSFASSAPRNIVFFSVSKEEKKNLLYSYNGGGHELQALALNWLGQAKPYHSWHSHTADNMTFGFLMHGGYTFFAIDNAGSSEMLLFLERLRDAFEAAPKNDRVEGELSWVVRIGAEKARTEERKPKDVYGGGGGGGGGESKVDVLQEDAGGVVSSGRSSSSVLKAQQCARRLWWRHAKTVAAVDVLLCLAMFAVWLVVCEGLQCVGRR
ncbi:phytolongin Phyl1.1-like [Musa acuminata AAA Group]|uniref:phytolongin Phyl1.1-like n=1 Tax=Musa acuminata AAA Group TaxID=214697 RepID=UPI0031D7B906